jgi:hypothetical protein
MATMATIEIPATYVEWLKVAASIVVADDIKRIPDE